MSLLRVRAPIAWFAAAALTLALWMFQHHEQQEIQGTAAAVSSQEPDAVITDVKLNRYNSLGQLEQVLEAKTASKFFDLEKTQFDSPHLIAFSDTGERWNATSRMGVLSGQEVLELSEMVEVSAQPSDQPVTPSNVYYLKTEYVSVDLKRNVATSTSPTQIYNATDHVYSDGFTLNLDQKEALLHSNVQGLHQARSKP